MSEEVNNNFEFNDPLKFKLSLEGPEDAHYKMKMRFDREMSQKTLKEFGLEFINEMAQDRKRAHEEIGAVISGTKSNLVDQSLPHFDYQDLNDFVKQVREATGKIVDTELTRLTLKSLGRIREIIQAKQVVIIPPIETSPVESPPTPTVDPNIQALKQRHKDQESVIEQLTLQRDQSQKIFETNQNELNRLQNDLSLLKNRLEHLQEQEALFQQRMDGLINEVNVKSALIEFLKKNEIIREKDVEEALKSVADTYKIQENYFQRMVEEELQQRVAQIRLEAEEDLQRKVIQVGQEKEEELREQTKQIRNEEKSRHKKEIQLREKHFQATLEQLEEERIALREQLEVASSSQREQNLLVDYTQRLLSGHPLYAAVLIMLNLGGSLDLNTMARSVGAHPVKLKGMLEELATKGLITITTDDPPLVQAIMQ